jgi:hypothetical protein
LYDLVLCSHQEVQSSQVAPQQSAPQHSAPLSVHIAAIAAAFCENICLAAHVMFAHHHLTPSMDRDKAGPMPFKRIPSLTPAAAAAAGTDTAGDKSVSEAAGQQQQQQQRPSFFQATKDPAGAFEYHTRKCQAVAG